MTVDLSFKPLTATIGAVVEGFHIGVPDVESHIPRLRDALNEYKVLFFHDQPISAQEQATFAGYFGEIAKPLVEAESAPAPGVTLIDQTDGKGGTDIWHSDHTFSERPPKAAMLRAVQLPSVGGDTIWADMCAAYDDLSTPMKRFLDPLTATHSTDLMIQRVQAKKKDAKFFMERSAVSHPVVRVHPETGRKALFVNVQYTARIDDVSPEESQALLAFLFRHIQSPTYQVRYKWRVDAVALWDEPSTIHYGVADYNERRVMHRLMIAGDRPFGPSGIQAAA